jgi:hypothetical protein
MGGCLWTERHAYFDQKTIEEYRTDMLVKYLRPRTKRAIKQQSSGEEGDGESGTDWSLDDDERRQEGLKDLRDFKKEEEKQTLGDSLFTPSPASVSDEETKQGVYAEQIVSQESPSALQPPLTRMSSMEEDGEVWNEDQVFLAGSQAIIIRRDFTAFTRQRKPVWLKPEVHHEPNMNQPVQAIVATKIKPRSGAEAILDDYADEIYDYSAAPVFYEDSGEDLPEAKASLGLPSHVHYLRSPAPALTQNLYHRNLLGLLTREEEELANSPLTRMSVRYSSGMRPMEHQE